ncbi:MAG: hypothetical protein IKO93_20465 [Lentisphaeria bacterium]|nr:hypothetical protein [Lentisphaeria bacterium]
MKALFFICAALLSAVSFADDLPKPEIIRGYGLAQGGQAILYSNAFENRNLPGMKLWHGFRIVPAEGVNGTSALKISAKNPNQKDLFCILELPDIPTGTKAIVSFDVRSEDILFKGKQPSKTYFPYAAVEYRNLKTKKNTSFATWTRVPISQQFEKRQFNFTAVDGYKPFLVFRLTTNWSGTIWFDNITVTSAGTKKSVFLNQPFMRCFSTSPKFRLTVCAGEIKSPALLIAIEQNGKILEECVLGPSADGSYEGALQNTYPDGFATMDITLADTAQQKRLLSSRIPVNFRFNAKVPANAVMPDSYGRLLVNGKPFMPVKTDVYLSAHIGNHGSMEEFRKICADLKASGFNMISNSEFLHTYKNIKNFCSFSDNKANDLLAVFDVLQEYGLKGVISMGILYDQYRWQPKVFCGKSGMRAMSAKVVETLKDHPALFLWYICDEQPLEDWNEVLAMREICHSLDPWHPTLACNYIGTLLPENAKLGDVFGVDNYPISNEAVSDISAIYTMMKLAQTSGVPLWGIVQAFNWAYYNSVNPKEYGKRFTTPSEEAVRGMTLLYALGGAKGFNFYSYPKTHHYREKMEKYGDKDYSDIMWKRTCRVVEDLKKMEPYILGKAAIQPIVFNDNSKGILYGGIFTADDGRQAVVVVSSRNAATDTTFEIPGKADLKSLHGRIQNLGNGKYRCVMDRIDGDIILP